MIYFDRKRKCRSLLDFWDVIDVAQKVAKSKLSPQNALAPSLIEIFSEFENDDLIAFDKISSDLHLSDDKSNGRFAIPYIKLEPIFLKYHFTLSTVQYFQFISWLIAKGKDMYYAVRADPDFMLDYIDKHVPTYVVSSYSLEDWIRDPGFEGTANAIYFLRNDTFIPNKTYFM